VRLRRTTRRAGSKPGRPAGTVLPFSPNTGVEQSAGFQTGAASAFSFNDPLPPAPGASLEFRNRQRAKKLNLDCLRAVAGTVLAELGARRWHLAFHFVGARKMAQINETHLGHSGPTDVITFDYAAPSTRRPPPEPRGEIFICVAVAVAQAREFRAAWQTEVARYLIHGCLHLRGYDDLDPAARRAMKREENRLLRRLERAGRLSSIGLEY